MRAILRQIRITSPKANLIAKMVRGKNVVEALDFLKFVPKKGARILAKVIASAAANAENNLKLEYKDLIIAKILVTEGTTYKRQRRVSRGRSYQLLKRTCHITVEVAAQSNLKEKGKESTSIKKIESKIESKVSEKATKEKVSTSSLGTVKVKVKKSAKDDKIDKKILKKVKKV